jgi:hypothetical protein
VSAASKTHPPEPCLFEAFDWEHPVVMLLCVPIASYVVHSRVLQTESLMPLNDITVIQFQKPQSQFTKFILKILFLVGCDAALL